MKAFILLFGSFLLYGCKQQPKKISEAEKEKYLTLGDSLTTETQKLLLKNVSEQVAQNGVANAVDFCSEKAISLTKTFENNSFEISRVSDKNRNAENQIKTEADRQAWNKISEMLANSSADNSAKHLILQADNHILYYKAIPLAMPTCLACHGSKQSDISPEVQQIIAQKYPKDKARDYKIGQLRGLWKVKIENN